MRTTELVRLFGLMLLGAQSLRAADPPRVARVRADCASGAVILTFTKPVSLDGGNYTLGNAKVLGWETNSQDPAEVILTTTTLQEGIAYLLTVSGVHDLDTPANFIAPNPTQWSVGCTSECGALALTSRIGPDGHVIIEWTAPAAVLQSSTNLVSWSDMPAAVSPHVVASPLLTAQFFRTRCDDATGPAPVLLRQPDSALTGAGSTVRLRAAVTGIGPLNYQWSFNGTNLAGATNQTLTLAGMNCAQSGAYELRASNTFGAVTSRVAYVAASNDACGLAFNTAWAEPQVRVLMLNSQNPPDLALSTMLAQPQTRVLLLNSTNPPDFPLNTTVADPSVKVLLLDSTNPPDFPLNTTLAEPPVRVLLLNSTNPPDFPLNTMVAQPPIAILIGTNQAGALILNVAAAQPPAPPVQLAPPRNSPLE